MNQTLDIIHAQLELHNWEKALERVVPMRKRKAAEEKKDGGKERGAGGGDDNKVAKKVA